MLRRLVQRVERRIERLLEVERLILENNELRERLRVEKEKSTSLRAQRRWLIAKIELMRKEMDDGTVLVVRHVCGEGD